ncbi:unnamed protein product [Rotaria socialis]|uniref:G-protein coupled receptors family 1 profile domain-containing protein n=1 Tax=Rotaria socialis TaxID=392032 RepID=A0A818FZC2_9BILA|nr:unnamed protein product [Rotaria socialis]CAF3483418.1 unnamed protein product [Rotaria socialis]CAF4405129.1 unnamed protein product [Rotaria socialis]CAF4515266.1 unnamed protein product [Rotaria socialis]
MQYTDSVISNPVRFWLLLIAMVPSVACSIAILYYTLSSRTRRRGIHNHFIILLLCNNLIYELIDISLFLNYYRSGTVVPATKSLCLMWMFVDETLYNVSTVTIAWASIERHIIIFHDKWLSSVKKRFLLHYAPYAIVITYTILFHFVVIVIPPCENTYNYTQEICGHPLCSHNSKLVGTWDSVVHNIIPAITIVIFSISLLARVLIKNHRMRRAFQWRKHRKIAIQLLLISFLYLLLYIPIICIELVQLCCVSEELNGPFEQYAHFFSYYVILLLPFVYMGSLIESSWQLKMLLPCWFRATQVVEPMAMTTGHFTARNPN